MTKSHSKQAIIKRCGDDHDEPIAAVEDSSSTSWTTVGKREETYDVSQFYDDEEPPSDFDKSQALLREYAESDTEHNILCQPLPPPTEAEIQQAYEHFLDQIDREKKFVETMKNTKPQKTLAPMTPEQVAEREAALQAEKEKTEKQNRENAVIREQVQAEILQRRLARKIKKNRHEDDGEIKIKKVKKTETLPPTPVPVLIRQTPILQPQIVLDSQEEEPLDPLEAEEVDITEYLTQFSRSQLNLPEQKKTPIFSPLAKAVDLTQVVPDEAGWAKVSRPNKGKETRKTPQSSVSSQVSSSSHSTPSSAQSTPASRISQELRKDREEGKRILESKENRQEFLRKTRMCVSIAKNVPCRHGAKCNFAHNVDELQVQWCAFPKSCRFAKQDKQNLTLYHACGDKECNYWHPQESKESYCMRLGIPMTVNKPVAQPVKIVIQKTIVTAPVVASRWGKAKCM